MNLEEQTKERTKKYYYLIKCDLLNPEVVKHIFDKRGGIWEEFNESKPQVKNPDFIYIFYFNPIYDYLHKYTSTVKNILDTGKNEVGMKNKLYENFYKLLEKNPNLSLRNYLSKQYSFDWMDIYHKHNIPNELNKIKNILKNNKPYIYKPVAGWAGKGIRVYNNFNKFEIDFKNYVEAYKKLWEINKNKNKLNKNRIINNNFYVLQEYITNPLLYEKKKFHLRATFLYVRDNEGKHLYMINRTFLNHAYEEYYEGNYLRKEIHDTHRDSTPKVIIFEEEYHKIMNKEQYENVMEQIVDLSKYVFELFDANCYPDAEYCFEHFGIDIMIPSDFKIKILEVQTTNSGFSPFNNTNKNSETECFGHYLFSSITEVVLDKYFPPIKKFTKVNGFTKIMSIK
jgi:uncharacterized protein YukE